MPAVIALICLTRCGNTHSSIAMGVKLMCLLSFVLQGLDNVSSATLRPFNSDINTPRIDSYRFSMANLEGKRTTRSSLLIPLSGKVTRSVGDLHTFQTRDAFPSMWGEKSLWTTCVDYSSRPAWWLLSDFSPFFSLHARFSLLRQVEMMKAHWRSLSIDRQLLSRSRRPGYFRAFSLILSFVSSRFREGRKRDRLPWCVNFSDASWLSPARPLRGFRSEKTLIVRQRSIGETANETRYISSCRKNLFRPFVSGLGYLYWFAFAASWSIDCCFLKRYEINLRSTLIVRVIQYVPLRYF